MPTGVPNRNAHSAIRGCVSNYHEEGTGQKPLPDPSVRVPQRLPGATLARRQRRQPFRSPLYPSHNEGLGGHNRADPDCVGAELAKPLFGSSMEASDMRTGPDLCPRGFGAFVARADECCQLSAEQLVGGCALIQTAFLLNQPVPQIRRVSIWRTMKAI